MSEKEKDDWMTVRLIIEAAACVAALLCNEGILTLLLEGSTIQARVKRDSKHHLLRATLRGAWTSIWTLLLNHDFLSISSNPGNLIRVVNSLVLNSDRSPHARCALYRVWHVSYGRYGRMGRHQRHTLRPAPALSSNGSLPSESAA